MWFGSVTHTIEDRAVEDSFLRREVQRAHKSGSVRADTLSWCLGSPGAADAFARALTCSSKVRGRKEKKVYKEIIKAIQRAASPKKVVDIHELLKKLWSSPDYNIGKPARKYLLQKVARWPRNAHERGLSNNLWRIIGCMPLEEEDLMEVVSVVCLDMQRFGPWQELLGHKEAGPLLWEHFRIEAGEEKAALYLLGVRKTWEWEPFLEDAKKWAPEHPRLYTPLCETASSQKDFNKYLCGLLKLEGDGLLEVFSQLSTKKWELLNKQGLMALLESPDLRIRQKGFEATSILA